MRLQEVSGLTTDEMLAEIDRRGFLKGLGAAAATAAVPSLANAAPWKHGQSKDEMDDTVYKFSDVTSNDGQARIRAPRNQGSLATLNVKDRIDFDHMDYGKLCARGRIKIGSSPPAEVHLNQLVSGSNIVSLLGLDKNYKSIHFDKIFLGLSKPTTIKIEVPIIGKGSKVYTFEIEPDEVTKNTR